MFTWPLKVRRIWPTLCPLPGTSTTELMVTNGGSDTDTIEKPLTPWNEATIVDCPVANAVVNPVEETVAMLGADDAHDTWLVKSNVLLSERRPIAVNCAEAPIVIVGLAGVTMIETRDAGVVPPAKLTRASKMGLVVSTPPG